MRDGNLTQKEPYCAADLAGDLLLMTIRGRWVRPGIFPHPESL